MKSKKASRDNGFRAAADATPSVSDACISRYGEVAAASAQATRPAHFANRWFVGGDAWEGEPNARRECEVLGYVRDEDGRDRCHVRFLDKPDLFADAEGYYTPWQLFPVLEAAHG